MTLIIRQLVNICFDLGKQHIPRFPNTKIITSGIFWRGSVKRRCGWRMADGGRWTADGGQWKIDIEKIIKIEIKMTSLIVPLLCRIFFL